MKIISNAIHLLVPCYFLQTCPKDFPSPWVTLGMLSSSWVSSSFCEAVLIDISIVFIHGLQGDPKGTWSTFNTFWPRDLLPKVLPQARILSWGYDSKVIHFWAAPSQNMINEHSSNLFADLASLRDSTNTVGIISLSLNPSLSLSSLGGRSYS